MIKTHVYLVYLILAGGTFVLDHVFLVYFVLI